MNWRNGGRSGGSAMRQSVAKGKMVVFTLLVGSDYLGR